MKRLIVIVAITLAPFAATAQSTGVLATRRPITWGMIFALLFLMLGPIKLRGPFGRPLRHGDQGLRSHLSPPPCDPRFPILGRRRHYRRRAWRASARQLCHSCSGVADRRRPNPIPRRPAGGYASIRRNPPARTH